MCLYRRMGRELAEDLCGKLPARRTRAIRGRYENNESEEGRSRPRCFVSGLPMSAVLDRRGVEKECTWAASWFRVHHPRNSVFRCCSYYSGKASQVFPLGER